MIGNLDMFGFQALWSPYLLVTTILITFVYFYITGKGRHRFNDSEEISNKQRAFFLSSMILFYLVKGSPVDLLSHLMLSAHMTQMAILYLVIPPILLMGMPAWVLRKAINLPVVKPVFRFISKPLIALLVFNVLFSLYHIPVVFDTIKVDMVYHTAYMSVMFVGAFIMWWPLVNPLPEEQRLSGIKKIGYIMADGMLLTPACALIIFADQPLYATYSEMTAWLAALELCVPAGTLAGLDLGGPELFNALPLVEDQQLGGVIMKIIQEIMYGSILAYVFFGWAKREREKDEIDLNKAMQPKVVE
ncbi:cytochrome C oxidase assembly protein [Bacillus sp. LL01]|uniref:cytochrome c oxidase assembly factor CtaG n=1 Tax=Bacillus sp. LL01 TaxID=1665556 RepID=UPI00064CE126|nr:cytochrome c oxidase assembly factor CtaG [Bacillus sp. LL01]KMJ58502.1 cytochrome C oxidase assembly protein [Bacillus sp. LL01]